jgi:hypothetical protein
MLFTIIGPSLPKRQTTAAERAEQVAELRRRVEAAELKARQAILAAEAARRCGSWDPNCATSASDCYSLKRFWPRDR